MAPLETLGFALAGYGCTTCIGNSGPLDEPIAKAIEEQRARHRGGPVRQPQLRGPDPSPRARELPRLAAARRRVRARGPGRHRPDDRAARHRRRRHARLPRRPLAGARTRSARSSATRSTPSCSSGPTPASSRATTAGARCRSPTATATTGTRRSTYVARPPYFDGLTMALPPAPDIVDARVARDPRRLGDDGPHLPRRLDRRRGRPPASGSRSTASARSSSTRTARGAATTRSSSAGTFGNIRLRNALASEGEGPYTRPPARRRGGLHLRRRGPLPRRRACRTIVIAGKEYGSGSSRDWAAKGPLLLGVRAVIAESFERIHRTNLVGMGILPLEFLPGENLVRLGLTGREAYTIRGRRRRPGAAGAAAGGGPRGRRRDDDLRGDLPHRRPDRARLLPQRRHPAGGPAPARARGRRRVGRASAVGVAATRPPPGMSRSPGSASRSARARPRSCSDRHDEQRLADAEGCRRAAPPTMAPIGRTPMLMNRKAPLARPRIRSGVRAMSIDPPLMSRIITPKPAAELRQEEQREDQRHRQVRRGQRDEDRRAREEDQPERCRPARSRGAGRSALADDGADHRPTAPAPSARPRTPGSTLRYCQDVQARTAPGSSS